MDLALQLRGVAKPVGALANHAVEQQAPVILTGGEALLGDDEHQFRHLGDRSNLQINLIGHASPPSGSRQMQQVCRRLASVRRESRNSPQKLGIFKNIRELDADVGTRDSKAAE